MPRSNSLLPTDSFPLTDYGSVLSDAEDNGKIIKNAFNESFDTIIRTSTSEGVTFVFAFCDALCDSFLASDCVIRPVGEFEGRYPKSGRARFISDNVLVCSEVTYEKNLNKVMQSMLSGSIAVFIDGESECLVCSMPKIPIRSISEPEGEVQEKGSREGFIENIKVNVSLIRKRLVTPQLKIDTMRIGRTSNTRVAVCYIENKADPKTVREVKARLSEVKSDTILGANYFRVFLDTDKKTLFSMVGNTERPDVLCAKLDEGKVGLMVDGTPFVLIVPYLFVENFQTMDDYLNRPFFATLIRLLRIACFGISILLPGIYVAIGLFHQELLPDKMLLSIVMSESNTMFPLVVEALVIHFIYEAVREAGLRMPKSVGNAVSIVGALVIGDAAVTAGLIGAPMLIVVAMTAISSFVVSALYQPVSLLRLLFIIVGGLTGLYGIMIGVGVLIINMCSITAYDTALLSPLVPYDASLFRDTFFRSNHKTLSRKVFNVGKLKK